jgi:hypothetical protein
MTAWRALLDAAETIRAKALVGERSLVEVPLAGIGWATVEAERARRELDALFGLDSGSEAGPQAGPTDGSSWEEQPRDAALGARVWLRRSPVLDEGPWLVVLEPDTEGRLAATLARHDEGLAVIYLGTGPYRAGRLRSARQPWGPHVVALDDEGAMAAYLAEGAPAPEDPLG